MYISSAALTASAQLGVMTAQNSLATAQKEVSTGTYADLGVTLADTSGQLLSMTQQSGRLAGYKATNGLVSTRLSGTDSVLSSLQTSATSFLQALTSASTGGGSNSVLQSTASGNLNNLIAGLNTTVGGDAIFGGLNSGTPPVAAYSSTSAAKQAVDNAFASTFGTSQTSPGAASITAAQMTAFLNTTFANLFSAGSFSTTWSTATTATQTTEIAPGQTVSTSVSANEASLRSLAQVYTMVSEFTGPTSTLSASAQQAVAAAATALVTASTSGLTDVRAAIGVSQTAVSAATTQIAAQSSILDTSIGDLHDVDVYALNTRISSLQTQIQAAFELTAALKKLSFTNYFSA